MLDRIVKLAILSSHMSSLVTEDMKFSTRPQLNVLIVSPFGSGKSTMLKKIETEGLGIQLRDYTVPGLFVSVLGAGVVLKGAVFKGAGRCILIDEFQRIPQESRDALLDIMEDQYTSRALGREAGTYDEESDFYTIKVRGGYVEIKVQASWIISTMSFSKRRRTDLALLSRCFPVNMNFGVDDAVRLFLGEIDFDLTNVKKNMDKTYKAVVTVEDEARKYLVRKLSPLISRWRLDTGFLTRCLWDIIRIAGVYSCIAPTKEERLITRELVEKAVKFAPFEVAGFGRTILTPKESDIYNVILSNDGITPTEIAEILGVSKNTVKYCLERLEKYRLVRKMKMGREVFYYVHGIS